MKITFQNNNETTDFSIKQLKLAWSGYVKRAQTTKRFGGDGAQEVGDDLVNDRTLDVRFEFTPDLTPPVTVAGLDLQYSDKLNEIAGFFLKKNAPFYMIDTDLDRRARIILSAFTDSVRSGLEKRVAFLKLKFKFLEAYWEDNTENVQVDAVTSGNTFIIDNDSKIDAFPLLEIVPTAANSDLLVQNQTTLDAFTLGSSSFAPGTTFLIDSRLGTVFLDNGLSQVENSVALADGSGFIKLAAGVNTILYQSAFGGVTITSKFRRRYAF